eukprot:TRINITY_DN2949_c0_g1_i3.p1 TRINITY_DN2949_c0_g1~~TRINITY_DN2949_c0_g1_i3.p1  ORF type:complete len:782 (+),score=111.62 TRINITY_DN2949_c0_g1_i3:151-2346(+)
MHDEAASHWIAMVDQTTLGHKYIKEQFGKIPTAGWQIDPFGHSSTQAALLSAEVGFDSLYFMRIDYQDRQQRIASSNMETIWRASPSYGTTADVFSGAFIVGYGPPDGFCYDQSCADPPIQDDPHLENYNVQDRVNAFVSVSLDTASHTKGNDIMFLMGSDFQLENANTVYKNLDKLIKYVNQDGRVKVFYSTPSIYTAAKLSSGVQWSIKTDDFFPYADNQYSYWTGYFTSRAALKRQNRVSSSLLNTVKQIEGLVYGNGSSTQKHWEADGVSQHHDGVSGTSKQHVAYDYARQLSEGANASSTYANGVFAKWLKDPSLSLSYCPKLNESVCSVSQTSSGFAVTIYNSLARARTETIRIPLNNMKVNVFDYKGAAVDFQVLDNPVTPVVVTEPPAPYLLAFSANLPALGYTTFLVQASTSSKSLTRAESTDPRADVVIKNSAVQVTFDGTTGLLKSIQDLTTGLTTAVTQNFYWYQSATSADGNNPSGAYIFRPNGTMATAVSSTASVSLVTGSIVNEVRQTFSSWLTQTVRLVGSSNRIEFEYNVGSIPIDDNIGKEIISRFSSDVSSGTVSYTDSNGREFIQRIKDTRFSYNYTVVQPVAGNYYPVNAATTIKDTTKQITILTDRSQAGASLASGQVELMVHRRTLEDDWRGVGEPMNETQGVDSNGNRVGPGLGIRGTHYLLLTTPSTAASVYRPQMDNVFSQPYLAFTPITDVSQFVSTHNTQQSF